MKEPAKYSLVIATLLAAGALAARETHREDIDPRFIKNVLQLLPSHSGLPPIADLSEGTLAEPQQMRTWDNEFKNMEGVRRPIEDPGVASSRESLLATTKETVGNVALPARGCELVISGKVVSSRATLAYHKLLVYSTYDVEVESVFKPVAKKVKEKPTHLKAILFGGALQFPSGNLMYCVVTGSGFMSIGKRHILFLSKPIKSIEPYAVGGIYLTEDAKVYPLFSDASTIPTRECQKRNFRPKWYPLWLRT